ncbi:MAG: hypothetical protein AB6733_24400 [Clostridiaceae bacterium]
MGYKDEEILELLNEIEKSDIIKDICEGPVKIGNRYYEFEEQDFFDGKLKMYIPNNFKDMDEEVKDIRYPSIHRPKIIKTDDTDCINITINLIDEDLDEYSVKSYTMEMSRIIKKLNPTNVFYSEGIKIVNDKNIGYFEFKSTAIDDFIYNLMFFFEFYGKPMMGTFSCIHEDYIEWRDIAFQVLKTVRVLEGDE